MSVLSRFTPRSCPLSPLWQPRLRMMFRLSWKRLLNLWSDPCHGACSRALPSPLALSRSCPRPLLVVLVAPSCSISVAPRVFLSRALLWPPLIARSPLAATPGPRPLPTALLSHGAQLAWLAAPLRVSHVPQPLLPPRPLLGGVVPQAPLKHGNTGGTSIAAELDALPSVQCGVRFSLMPLRPVPCACCADSSSDDDEQHFAALVCRRLRCACSTFGPP